MMVLIKQGPHNTGVNIHTGTCSYDGPHNTGVNIHTGKCSYDGPHKTRSS